MRNTIPEMRSFLKQGFLKDFALLAETDTERRREKKVAEVLAAGAEG